jgi:putative protease
VETLAGRITHYYTSAKVAAMEVSSPLEVGNKIRIKGHTTDFEQIIESMQIEHDVVTKATKGQVIGLKVKDYVREHDMIYRVDP